jgi:hypothetical protein
MPIQTITPPATRKLGEDVFQATFPHSFNFRIELPFPDAMDFIRQIGPYNDFHPEAVIQAMNAVDRIIPRTQYPTDDPCNGERNYRLSVGREESPVIYIDRSELPIQRQAVAPLSDADIRAICRAMEFLGRADEAYPKVYDFGNGYRSIQFRFWWD